MNFYDYIECSKDRFIKDYLDARLVTKNEHPKFPLDLYCYSRSAVHDDIWDTVTTRCRGIIVNRETGEIVSRPFQKFHNYGSTKSPSDEELLALGKPVVWEKLDGFMCTGYKWENRWYVASKGSFTSPHAKWATSEIQKMENDWPEVCTPCFEGLTPNLRIVVDYGDREGLVLTALINKETGEETPAPFLITEAARQGIQCAKAFFMTWQDAAKKSLDPSVKNEEGYVLTWYRSGTTPFRLKVKYQDYLKLHRLVTSVGPKRILEALREGWGVDFMSNDAPVWFRKYVNKWRIFIELEYNKIEDAGNKAYEAVQLALDNQRLHDGRIPVRKDWAIILKQPEFKEVSAIVFAKMDGKPTSEIIWKMIKNSELMKGGKPLLDVHNL